MHVEAMRWTRKESGQDPQSQLRQRLERSFLLVRLALFFSLLVLLLAAYCLVFVEPEAAAYSPLVLAMLVAVAFFASAILTALRTRKQYQEMIDEDAWKRKQQNRGGSEHV